MEKEYRVDEDGKYVLVFPVPLPKIVESDGAIIRYSPHYIPSSRATRIFQALRMYEKDAENAQGIAPSGKPYISERRSIQISDPGVRAYNFNGVTATTTEPFNKYPEIDMLRTKIYEDIGVWCNFCLYNAYTPEAKLGWHGDSEKDMVEDSTVASLSFGDVRRFRIRRKDNHKIIKEIYLESGSLLTMEGKCQKIMDHSVWKMTQKELVVHGLRINLTFRIMKPK